VPRTALQDFEAGLKTLKLIAVFDKHRVFDRHYRDLFSNSIKKCNSVKTLVIEDFWGFDGIFRRISLANLRFLLCVEQNYVAVAYGKSWGITKSHRKSSRARKYWSNRTSFWSLGFQS
jgi:hypothetical protein